MSVYFMKLLKEIWASLTKFYLKKKRKKSLAQEVRQKNDISERRSKTLFATRPTVSLCDLSVVILHQK